MTEILRLRELYSYQILDSPPEEEFDELVELAAMFTNCPVALITFIDKNRQWIKAKTGVEQMECDREVTFCDHTIKQDEVMVVANAADDVRFSGNPMVTGGIRLRFYAGVPIYSSMGYKIGTLCVIDKRSKIFLPKQVDALYKLSKQVSRLLELRSKNMLLKRLLEDNAYRNGGSVFQH